MDMQVEAKEKLKAREWFLEKWNKFQHVWSLEYIGVGG